uniref:RRM domain-containing protein n=1 Tax=Arabidopsis thaliana TaxID=3702 RepID=Q56W97_ARATH|nr:hypothetical protein [Arabidopsis thaliana]
MFYGYDYVSELIVSFVCYCLIARLIKDQQTQRPKGFGFITFESEDDAQKALKALNGKVKIHFFNLHSLLKCSMYLWL